MRRTFKRNAIALVFAPVLALPAAALQAAGDKQAQQQQPKSAQQEQKPWVEKSRRTYDERTVTGEERGSAPGDRGAAAGGSSMTDPMKKQDFSALDSDNDGTLSMMEAASDPDAKQHFKKLDKDNDYKLSRSEYEALEKVSSETTGGSAGGKAASGATAQPESQKQQGQQAQNQRSQEQQSEQAGRDLQKWDVAILYRTGWSAEQMLDTQVRGENGEEIGEVEDIIVGKDGKISKIVVETGGFFDIGDEHIGVPWNEVRIGPEMQWVQVPLREDNVGGFSLFTGEHVAMQESSWRVDELIGDYVSLRDIPRYGLARDVIFDSSGKAMAVVVDRPAGTWGAGGRYAYPYTGHDRTAFAYPLPYGSADLAGIQRFDYVLLGEQSPQARAPEERSERRSAAGGATSQSAGKQDRSGDKSWVEKSRGTLDERSGSAASGGSSQQSGSGATGSSTTEPVQTQSFSALDRNNDGTLSMMEAAADPDAKQRFKELDKNNDSRLSRPEYEAR